jgi:hypothetical protein
MHGTLSRVTAMPSTLTTFGESMRRPMFASSPKRLTYAIDVADSGSSIFTATSIPRSRSKAA